MEAVVKQAQDDLGMYGKKTILFIDGSVLHKGKKIILLSLVEAVDLINEYK